ncbi:hypothetical protein KAI58_00450 [Candidatus Gracilibacteria bacterium]|nr:hypothetical protein [Candidatus Gracilibacteria bacterium]
MQKIKSSAVLAAIGIGMGLILSFLLLFFTPYFEGNITNFLLVLNIVMMAGNLFLFHFLVVFANNIEQHVPVNNATKAAPMKKTVTKMETKKIVAKKVSVKKAIPKKTTKKVVAKKTSPNKVTKNAAVKKATPKKTTKKIVTKKATPKKVVKKITTTVKKKVNHKKLVKKIVKK